MQLKLIVIVLAAVAVAAPVTENAKRDAVEARGDLNAREYYEVGYAYKDKPKRDAIAPRDDLKVRKPEHYNIGYAYNDKHKRDQVKAREPTEYEVGYAY